MIVDRLLEYFFNEDYENTFLMQNDYLLYGISIFYVVFVQLIGPSLMKQRKAFDFYYFVVLFNAMLMIGNAYLCLISSKTVIKYWSKKCYLKSSPDFKNIHMEFGYILWQVLLFKIIELFDTVLFILRKKFNQVSFLHVFHHAGVIIFWWTALRMEERVYYGILISAMNTGIHIFTYLYYGLSAIGPGMRKYLWWKKYLTMIQIIQFIIFLSYLVYCSLTGCEEIAAFEKVAFAFVSALCVLFIKFYIKSYSKAD